MSINYNLEISKLSGQVKTLAEHIQNDPSLKRGEKILYLQRLIADIKPAQKIFQELKLNLEKYAKKHLEDTGDGTSDPIQLDGAEVFVKYIYHKPQLDPAKLKNELEKVYEERGEEFNEEMFSKESTPRKQVIIQNPLDAHGENSEK